MGTSVVDLREKEEEYCCGSERPTKRIVDVLHPFHIGIDRRTASPDFVGWAASQLPCRLQK